MKLPALLLSAVVTSAACAPAASQEAPGDATSAASRRMQQGLALLQRSEALWRTRRSCVSCHHQFLGAVTMALAKEQGVPVDNALLSRHEEALETHAIDYYFLSDAGINGQFGNAYVCLALGAVGRPQDRVSDTIAHFLAGRQHPDGSWRSESYRPPLEASAVSVTALALRALQLYAPPGRSAEFAGRIERAVRWLKSHAPGNNEEHCLRLLGLAWANAGTEDAARELLAQQREDGSWGQLATRPGDAYATGQALVVLNQGSGVPWSDPRMEAGAAWLVSHREEDGSWHVTTRRRLPGLLYFETGFPHGEDQFISCAATNWASMALLLRESPRRSAVLMGPPSRITARSRLPDDPTTTTSSPLLFALAAGDGDAVREALARGADVNAANAGGATPLMAAVHDPALLRLLLDAGADPTARAGEGQSALLLAAAYSGALESLKILMDVSPPAKPELDRAFLAAVGGGDQDKMALLLAAGADIDVPDSEGYRPVHVAAYLDDTATLQLLLEHGADATARGTDGATPLMGAAEIGLVEVAKLLLDHGADPLATDDEGHTALHVAALLDPGHADMVSLLVEEGADPLARDDEGVTPLDLARGEHSEHLVRLLAPGGER